MHRAGFVLPIFFLAACRSSAFTEELGSGGAGGEGNTCISTCEGCEDLSAASLFDGEIGSFDIEIPDDRWKYMNEHALDEEYEEACVSYNGKTIGTIGVRYKGAVGSLANCFRDGELVCDKLSLKLKLNEVDRSQRFFGLKRLNLHSMTNDASRLREKISYGLYREMGVKAPRSHWANVRVNGTDFGVYSLVEQIDGRFTDDRFPDQPDGNLFKERLLGSVTGASAEGVDFFTGGLKTNEESTSVDAAVLASEEIVGASLSDRPAVLERYSDVEYLLRYMAVDDAIFNVDGVTAFYGDEERAENHNFYIYQEMDRDYFWLIPWDLDGTLQVFSEWFAVPHWTKLPDDCDRTYPVWGGEIQVVAPGCVPFFQGVNQSDLTAYFAAIDELVAGPFSPANLEKDILKYVRLLEPAIESDPFQDLASFHENVDVLVREIDLLRERLLMIKEGEDIVLFTLATSQPTDFEELSPFSLRLGTTIGSNPESSSAIGLETAQPLVDGQSLRFDFEFRNGDAAWEHWMFFSMPLQGAPRELSELSGVRFSVRADAERTLRVDLQSSENSLRDEGISVGFEVPVGGEQSVVEVLFEEARVPAWVVDAGRDPKDPLLPILQSISGLTFSPLINGRDGTGFLPRGESDAGSVYIDEIEFF